MVQQLTDKRMDKVSEMLPTKIEATFEIPKVYEMVLASGRDNVAAFIEFEMIKLSALVSVGGNLNKAQIVFFASELIDLFPSETIADIKICFQRGARGDFGDVFRLDGIVIRGWMESYLEQKYQVMENILMKEKDNFYKVDKEDISQKYLDIMKDQLKPENESTLAKNFAFMKGISNEEIQREGKERPIKKEYVNKQIDKKYFDAMTKIRKVCGETYKGIHDFREFKNYSVEGYEIFCESQERANEIYIKAITE